MSSIEQSLARYGWNEFFAAHFHEFSRLGYIAGRIILEYNQFYRVYTAQGEMLAEIAGRLKYDIESRAGLPAAGDWVALHVVGGGDNAVIHAVLPRRSKFTRKTNKTEEQVVGA
ncbi:MAG: ribosome small subunit-dependent GTPase, partial [Blastocatellia bacterium]|nr:ribosome small subunit-dependent GTPase [Blastocatellia bacterium]